MVLCFKKSFRINAYEELHSWIRILAYTSTTYYLNWDKYNYYLVIPPS